MNLTQKQLIEMVTLMVKQAKHAPDLPVIDEGQDQVMGGQTMQNDCIPTGGSVEESKLAAPLRRPAPVNKTAKTLSIDNKSLPGMDQASSLSYVPE